MERVGLLLSVLFFQSSFGRLFQMNEQVKEHIEELIDYKITPKGMVQIYLKQGIPDEIMKQIFAETLGR